MTKHRSTENCEAMRGMAAELSTISRVLTRLIWKLRRGMKECQACPQEDDCALLKSFNEQVKTAIQAVWNEWTEPGER